MPNSNPPPSEQTRPEGWDSSPRAYAAAYQSKVRSFLDQMVLYAVSTHRDEHGTTPSYEQMCQLGMGIEEISEDYVSLSLTRLVEDGYLIATPSGLVTLTAADLAAGIQE